MRCCARLSSASPTRPISEWVLDVQSEPQGPEVQSESPAGRAAKRRRRRAERCRAGRRGRRGRCGRCRAAQGGAGRGGAGRRGAARPGAAQYSSTRRGLSCLGFQPLVLSPLSPFSLITHPAREKPVSPRLGDLSRGEVAVISVGPGKIPSPSWAPKIVFP